MALPLNTSSLLRIDGAAGGSTSNLAAGFVFTAGNDAVFKCSHWNNNSGQYISGVTISGKAATLISRTANGLFVSEIWLAKGVTGGTQTVSITFGAGSSANYISGAATEWAAADALTYDTGTANGATGTGTAPSVSTAVTTSQANTVSIACVTAGVGGNSNVGLSGPTGWTAVFTEQDDNNHVAGRAALREETTAGVKTATFAQTASGAWVATIASFKVAGGAPTPPTVDTDPTNQSAMEGGVATFTCTASSHGGTGLSYQWQVNNGGGWVDVGTNSNSYTTPTLTLGMDGYLYRVTVTDSAGSDTSASATLDVTEYVLLPTIRSGFPVVTDHAAANEPYAVLSASFSANAGDELTAIAIGAGLPTVVSRNSADTGAGTLVWHRRFVTRGDYQNTTYNSAGALQVAIYTAVVPAGGVTERALYTTATLANDGGGAVTPNMAARLIIIAVDNTNGVGAIAWKGSINAGPGGSYDITTGAAATQTIKPFSANSLLLAGGWFVDGAAPTAVSGCTEIVAPGTVRMPVYSRYSAAPTTPVALGSEATDGLVWALGLIEYLPTTHAKPTRKLLVLGDSGVESTNSAYQIPAKVQDDLAPDWEVFNQAVWWAFTDQCLSRWNAAKATFPEFDAAIVYIGINDVVRDNAWGTAQQNNVSAIYNDLEALGVPIAAFTGLGPLAGAGAPQSYYDARNWITANAPVGSHLFSYDLVFDPAQNYLVQLPQYSATDGGHTNAAGNTIIGADISAWIDTLVFEAPPVIDTDPNSRAANTGGIAEFYCHATSNGGTGGTYQWATNDGGGWTNVGTNSTLYTRTGVASSDDELQIRCTYTDSAGSDVSTTATLTVISTWPEIEALSELAFGDVEVPADEEGITGTADSTAQQNVATCSGVVQISASSASVQGANTSASSATSVVSGANTSTQVTNATSANGGCVASGSASVAQVGNATSSAGAVAVGCQSNSTQTENACAGVGAVVVSGSADSTQTENVSTISGSTGSIPLSGTVEATQAVDASSAQGGVLTLATSESAQVANTASVAGATLVSGTAASVQEKNVDIATGAAIVSGVSASNQSSNSTASTSKIAISGTSVAAQGANASVASSRVSITGSCGSVQAVNSSDASGEILGVVSGVVSATQASNIQSTSATLTVSGTVGSTQSVQIAVSNGGVLVSGEEDATQGLNSASTIGGVTISGTESAIQGENTSESSGIAMSGIGGVVGAVQGLNTSAASGTTTISGSVVEVQSANVAASASQCAIAGVGVATQAANDSDSTGSIGYASISGVIAVEQGINSSAAAGTTLSSGNSATLQDVDSSSCNGSVGVLCIESAVQEKNTSSSVASVAISGAVVAIEHCNESASSCAVEITCASASEASNTSVALGALEISGSADCYQIGNASDAATMSIIFLDPGTKFADATIYVADARATLFDAQTRLRTFVSGHRDRIAVPNQE